MIRSILVFFNKIKGFLLGIAFVFVLFSFLLNASYTIQLRYQNEELENKIFELENMLLSAEEDLELANTDVHIHKVATERLGLVKTGELPVNVIVENKEEEAEEMEPNQEQKKKFEVYLTEWYRELTNLFN